MPQEVFHAGEIAVQDKTGEREKALLNSRMVSSAIPAGARSFLADQRYCVFGWASPAGSLWASLVTGAKGFAAMNGSATELTLDLPESQARTLVPPFSEMKVGDRQGALFIDLTTRRRLRVNGAVSALTPTRLHLQVEEAFPNCPKYIQRRAEVPVGLSVDAAPQMGELLTDDLRAWIETADTLFVASAHSDGRADASHRGGPPGFVRVERDGLWVPDYPGNSMFGTLGNFSLNPKAGLTFVDFDRSRQLQLTGDVRLDLDRGDPTGETGGTGRWWFFTPRAWVVSSLDPALGWSLADASPFNPQSRIPIRTPLT